MDKDAIIVLSEDPSSLEGLFARVSQPDEDRPAVLAELLRALSAHVAVEKRLVAPVLLEHGADGKVLSEQLGQDHDAIDKLIILIERRKVNSPDVPGLVSELLDITARHTDHADDCLLPFLRDRLNEDELARLGAAMRSDELEFASHPHPHLPDRGPLAKITRKAAALIDQARDSSTDLQRPGL